MIERSRTTYVLLGLLGAVILLGAAAAAIGVNRGMFNSSVTVTLVSDRSGLMLESGSDVKMRDVVVGRVRTVRAMDGKAVITLDIDSARAPSIPTNTAASIDLTTLFGRKFVALTQPTTPASTHITPGFTFTTSSIPTEMNDLLEGLVNVLRSVEPDKVNGALNAVSTALHGRGDQLGDTLVNLDTYLAQFNGSLPTLQRDLSAAATTSDVGAGAAPARRRPHPHPPPPLPPPPPQLWRGLGAPPPPPGAAAPPATPDLMRTLDNLTTTGNTITEKQTALTGFILSFTRFGNTGHSFTNAAGTPLVESMRSLAPTTGLLAERAPSLPCFVTSLAQTNGYLERAVGGSDMPGLNILGTLLMGDPPYTAPKDLPVVAADGPAQCYDWTNPLGHTDFNDGSHAYGPVRGPGDLIGNPFAQFFPGVGR
ncbi:MCE family protein [Nocardia wallacei]|uniref:MCE family protein n=1 Tax=Nocardia wallacei TaxID=480035 RepID=UPI002458591A|nr:MCE family protein [Nocardia wallacei]